MNNSFQPVIVELDQLSEVQGASRWYCGMLTFYSVIVVIGLAGCLFYMYIGN